MSTSLHAMDSGPHAELVKSRLGSNQSAPAVREQQFNARADLSNLCPLSLLDGVCYRYWSHPSGRMQIVDLFFPGDVLTEEHDGGARCHTRSLTHVSVIPNGAGPGTDVTFAEIAAEAERRQNAIRRQWLINVGSRNALERCAHLICEIYTRLSAAGLTKGSNCAWPFTQADVGNALALSSVHVNRMLRLLRFEAMAEIRARNLYMADFGKLKELCGFNDGYLSPIPRS